MVVGENVCKQLEACRLCQDPLLPEVVNLGEQHIGSVFVKDDVPDMLAEKYPLSLVRCTNCGLVQLKHSISPDILYSDYGYRSGINESMRANLKDIVLKAQNIVDLHADDVVLDIGCNDGTLLEYYPHIIKKIGVDPAVKITKFAKKKNIEVIDGFFSYDLVKGFFPNIQPKIITSVAMFYDLEDPFAFAQDVARLLHDEGLWIIELSYLPRMLESNSYDTICHEHLEYYSLKQIEWILEKLDLQVCKIEFNDTNGGSFRLFIQSKKAEGRNAFELDEVRKQETLLKLDSDKPYEAFRISVEQVRNDLISLLQDLRAKDKNVYIYGASTKGNTILQYCGIDHRLIQKAAERNPDKWKRYTLGTNIPIVSEDEARTDRPDYFLVLPWHFLDGFLKREEEFLKQGGKFITPLPEVRVIGWER